MVLWHTVHGRKLHAPQLVITKVVDNQFGAHELPGDITDIATHVSSFLSVLHLGNLARGCSVCAMITVVGALSTLYIKTMVGGLSIEADMTY